MQYFAQLIFDHLIGNLQVDLPYEMQNLQWLICDYMNFHDTNFSTVFFQFQKHCFQDVSVIAFEKH